MVSAVRHPHAPRLRCRAFRSFGKAPRKAPPGCGPCLILAALLPFAPCPAAYSASAPPQSAALFAQAERLRTALENIPQNRRSAEDYDRVLNAYRAIYHGRPSGTDADASVSAVAGLLAEEGRVLQSPRLLHDAIGQYEFLRHQYPFSRYRFMALIAEGDIYRDDLHDSGDAAAKFEEFLAAYPKNGLAERARIELADLKDSPPQTPAAAVPQPAPPQTAAAAPDAGSVAAPAAGEARTVVASMPESKVSQADSEPPSGAITRVTGIRHWSTPRYTRIAIDLGDEVRYQVGRISGPERFYFDLHNARVVPQLNGQTVAVNDDGFVRRIRVAQFSANVVRIVLDVGPDADYSAFFLPNPWRLIIDIHKRGDQRAAGPGVGPGIGPGVGPGVGPGIESGSGVGSGIASGISGGGSTLPAAPPSGSAKPALHQTAGPAARPTAETERHSPPAAAAAGVQRPVENELAEVSPAAGEPPANPAVAANSIAHRKTENATGERAPKAQDRDSASGTSDLGTSAGKTPARSHAANGEGSEADKAQSAGRGETELPAGSQLTLARALGLKIGRIVIDAGHGGHDSGTLGPGGMQEKTVVLDVALRLGKLLRQRLGAEVIYTRRRDIFVPLKTRTEIANNAQADLFISIHANSSRDHSARGVETYYLNFTTSPEAMEVAARENAVSDESVHDLPDLVKEITLKDKIEESHAFAADVQQALYEDLEGSDPGLKDRGVKKAPFVVLAGAEMPSILAEISFLTNPEDAHDLSQPAYRQKIAESLYDGIAKYIAGMNGVRLAEAPNRP